MQRKRRTQPGNNNSRKHGIYAKSLDAVVAPGVHCHDADPTLIPVLLHLQAILCRNSTIIQRWSAPAGTNQAKTPESTKTLPERIEAKTTPSPPTPASKRHPKVNHFLPVFDETNQPRLCQKRLLHCVQDHIWNIVVEEGVVFGS